MIVGAFFTEIMGLRALPGIETPRPISPPPTERKAPPFILGRRGSIEVQMKTVTLSVASHADVHALLNAGVLERVEDDRIAFPYDAVHVDFTLTRAA
ncbi:hypothetical protein [Vineibacter terrae]|uniref:hypothetical protein n=1 Tax=Vineibacter terrae TaxID=2586908 RepID=UPI001C49909C|nr:hypothetical protein [Vineibacter terrae]